MPDPRTIFVSPNFRLFEFLGNHSVYTEGIPNLFGEGGNVALKVANLTALARHGLEPLLARVGPISIGYGYISPTFSRRTVTYQDPNRPSHHRFDLGAACDFVAHNWVQGLPLPGVDTFAPVFENSATGTAPISLALHFDEWGIPFSRAITYSESPYICLAISAAEVAAGDARGAFYENRYEGRPRAKPGYLKYSSPQARRSALGRLEERGLPQPWYGAGYPTYHGGGRNQMHHKRASRYTMVSDWLFDGPSVAAGEKNVPNLSDPRVVDMFIAAGETFDRLQESDLPRLSILRGYVAPMNPSYDYDWAWHPDQGISFEVGGPQGTSPNELHILLDHVCPSWARLSLTELGVRVDVPDVDDGMRQLAGLDD